MKQRITLSISAETHQLLKEQVKVRNISVKKLGEEYFYQMVEKLTKEATTKNL